MLPSIEARVASIFGIVAGCLAIFLSEWGISGLPDIAWKGLALLAVCALFSMRLFPSKMVNMAAVRERAGDKKVDSLIKYRRLAIMALMAAFLLSVLLAPIISNLSFKRTTLIISLAVFLISVGIFSVVEIGFRSLLIQDDIKN